MLRVTQGGVHWIIWHWILNQGFLPATPMFSCLSYLCSPSIQFYVFYNFSRSFCTMPVIPLFALVSVPKSQKDPCHKKFQKCFLNNSTRLYNGHLLCYLISMSFLIFLWLGWSKISSPKQCSKKLGPSWIILSNLIGSSILWLWMQCCLDPMVLEPPGLSQSLTIPSITLEAIGCQGSNPGRPHSKLALWHFETSLWFQDSFCYVEAA